MLCNDGPSHRQHEKPHRDDKGHQKDPRQGGGSPLENSCEELDAIVDAAKAIPEVYGARLSGGGFGGSCCLLVDPAAADAIAAKISAAYKAKFGDEPVCSLIKPSDGASLV